MGIEENKAKALRIFEDLFNKGDDSWVDTELFDPGFKLHAPPLRERGAGGPQDVKDFVRAIHVGFPDIRIQVEDMIAEGDKVVARWRTTSQTHSGPYRGAPPTDRLLKMTGVHIFRFRDGKLHETWLELDALGMAEQMGLVPTESMSTFRKMFLMLSTPLRIAFLEARYQIRSGRAGTKAN
jgi:predicted SnoaL-like aldol condensation-catalyzing enzyme